MAAVAVLDVRVLWDLPRLSLPDAAAVIENAVKAAV
jgi:hypothetical protein